MWWSPGYIDRDEGEAHRAETLDALADRSSWWSRCIAVAEALSVDADERGDGADRDFWTDVMSRCEDRYEEAARAYDATLHWGEAA